MQPITPMPRGGRVAPRSVSASRRSGASVKRADGPCARPRRAISSAAGGALLAAFPDAASVRLFGFLAFCAFAGPIAAGFATMPDPAPDYAPLVLDWSDADAAGLPWCDGCTMHAPHGDASDDVAMLIREGF